MKETLHFFSGQCFLTAIFCNVRPQNVHFNINEYLHQLHARCFYFKLTPVFNLRHLHSTYFSFLIDRTIRIIYFNIGNNWTEHQINISLSFFYYYRNKFSSFAAYRFMTVLKTVSKKIFDISFLLVGMMRWK